MKQLEMEPARAAVVRPKASEGVSYALAALARWTWIFLALVTLADAVSGALILDGRVGLLFAFMLFLAGLFSIRVYRQLGVSKRARIGMAVVLTLFVISQLTTHIDKAVAREWAPGADFGAYYTAAAILEQHSPAPLYAAPHARDGRLYLFLPAGASNSQRDTFARAIGVPVPMPFIYPPFAAVLGKPFAALQFADGYRLWCILSVALTLVAIFVTLQIAGVKSLVRSFVVCVVAVLSSFPFQNMLFFGQMGALMLLLWAGGAYLLLRRSPAWSAFCFAVGTMIKLTPVLVVPIFMLRRQWRWLVAYCGSILLLGCVSIWGAGWKNHVIFASSVLPSMSCGTPGYPNRSLQALVQNLCFGQVPLVMYMEDLVVPQAFCIAGKITAVFVLIAVLFVFYWRNQTSKGLVHEVVLLAAVSLLVSPISWQHHYVLGVLPLVYLWTRDIPGGNAGNAYLALLGAATLVSSTHLTDYVAVLIRNAALDLIVCGSIPFLMLVLVLISAGNNETFSICWSSETQGSDL